MGKEVKTHKFNGRKYHLIFTRLDGWTDTEDDGKQWMLIARDLQTKAGMETAIHEALHACSWSSKEITVEKTAKELAKFLWRLGYRLET